MGRGGEAASSVGTVSTDHQGWGGEGGLHHPQVLSALTTRGGGGGGGLHHPQVLSALTTRGGEGRGGLHHPQVLSAGEERGGGAASSSGTVSTDHQGKGRGLQRSMGQRVV